MMGRGAIVLVVALAGCASEPQAARPFSDPAVQALFDLPTQRYFATTTLAKNVAANCARYTYDAVLDEQLNEERNKVGRGSLTAGGLRNAIELEQDVTNRSFAAKHGVELTGSDLCPAADAETLENSALSAMLVPVS